MSASGPTFKVPAKKNRANEQVRAKRWAVTINLGIVAGDTLPHWEELPEGVTYMFWQRERGSKTQREHLQMYWEYAKRVTSAKQRERFGGFWGVAQGDVDENKVYCSKEDDRVGGPWELGVPAKVTPGPVAGSKRAACFESIRKSGFIETLLQEPTLICAAGLSVCKEFSFHLLKKTRGNDYRPPQILILFGPTGVGKSALANSFYSKTGSYRLCFHENIVWWDGYYNESVIIMDEFYGQIQFTHMLDLLDGYANRVAVKGGFSYLDNKVWILTSNSAPWLWWKNLTEEKKAPFYNRIFGRFDSCVCEMFADGTKTFYTSVPAHHTGVQVPTFDFHSII